MSNKLLTLKNFKKSIYYTNKCEEDDIPCLKCKHSNLIELSKYNYVHCCVHPKNKFQVSNRIKIFRISRKGTCERNVLREVYKNNK